MHTQCDVMIPSYFDCIITQEMGKNMGESSSRLKRVISLFIVSQYTACVATWVYTKYKRKENPVIWRWEFPYSKKGQNKKNAHEIPNRIWWFFLSQVGLAILKILLETWDTRHISTLLPTNNAWDHFYRHILTVIPPSKTHFLKFNRNF